MNELNHKNNITISLTCWIFIIILFETMGWPGNYIHGLFGCLAGAYLFDIFFRDW